MDTDTDSGAHDATAGFPGGALLSRVFDAVGVTHWPSLGFQSEPNGPILAMRMIASVLIHAYSQGLLTSEEVAEACRTRSDFRYLWLGDAPEPRVFRRFRRHHNASLVEGLARFWTPADQAVNPVTLDRARRCLAAAVEADSLALDF